MDIIIKNHGAGYWSKERTERVLRKGTKADVKREVPHEVLVSYLDRDFTKGRGKDDREVCKRVFRKMPTEAIADACGKGDPDRDGRK